ncbi:MULTISPECIES: phage terminase small subunit [Sphingomonas]|uniref:Terminase n=2 Tax=Sphingomonas paucimobilis TaxID=13689 RepID=A0A411LHF9_SPHPI|nr:MULTISPECIES: phage terminase small subunit [Sphingomonas]MBQ1481140.1 terminase [Sphingomonas sp.]NNG57498.1 terminase [Sphingomonas paucimobilis]QBE91757.1 terminase [Sphingomonas paucimobilis]QPS16834.1 terminase [Sphingomonas paucimobilis]QPT08308.1 terminase [Sphingomonas paucimobilis]
MSLARQNRDHVLSLIAANGASAPGGGLTPADLRPETNPYTPAAEVAAKQIMLRLTHDLRRLKDIKSVANKIAAKREMVPEYAPWIEGELAAGEAIEPGKIAPSPATEVLPTVMVWSIDIGEWPLALRLASHVLRHDVPLPARYERDAPTLILEEVAEAALRAQNAGGAFPLDVLQQVEELVDGVDMHDQPRAKMQKAIGAELVRACEALPDGSTDRTNVAARAIEHLRQAFALDPRIGVKTVIQRLEKSLPKLPTESLSVPAGVDGTEAHPAAPAVNADSVVATTAKDGNDATPPLEK